MFKQAILFFLIFFSFSSFAQTTILMENHGGIYVVPCSVNGLNLKFIFDTGASDVSISSTEALFMLKNGYLKSEDILGKQNYSNANGEISVGTKILLRQIEFAGLKLYNVEASIVNNLEAPLLLGQSAISKLGRIQLDGNKLTILNGSLKTIGNISLTNATTCSKFLYRAYLTQTPAQYMFLYSEKTFKDQTKRIIALPEKAAVYVLEENTGDDLFYYVCYNGVQGYISKNLLIKN